MNDWRPMLLKEACEPFDDDAYLFEVKFDGIRALIYVSPNSFIIKNRYGNDISRHYPELAFMKTMVTGLTIFDGELVCFQDGMPSFSTLQKRAHLEPQKIGIRQEEMPVSFIAFDLLYEQSTSLIHLPLIERKKRLVKYSDTSLFAKAFYIEKTGVSFFKKASKLGLEGIVAKEKQSLYFPNERSDVWLKIKNWQENVFLVGGYCKNIKSDTVSLFLGEYQNSHFQYVGKVVLTSKASFYGKLLKARRGKNPFDEHMEGVFLKPTLRVRIRYLKRTFNHHLRQPIFIEESN